jgi:hypothetical protein
LLLDRALTPCVVLVHAFRPNRNLSSSVFPSPSSNLSSEHIL